MDIVNGDSEPSMVQYVEEQGAFIDTMADRLKGVVRPAEEQDSWVDCSPTAEILDACPVALPPASAISTPPSPAPAPPSSPSYTLQSLVRRRFDRWREGWTMAACDMARRQTSDLMLELRKLYPAAGPYDTRCGQDLGRVSRENVFLRSYFASVLSSY